jgi:hypothetical protein
MAREPAPPKGIQKITKRNTDSESTFFRVRMNRAKENFSVDRLFDTLAVAIAFLDQCKTREGRAAVMSGTDEVSASIQYQQIASAAAEREHPGIDADAIRAGVISKSIKDAIGGKHLTVNDAIASYSRVHILPHLPNSGLTRNELKRMREQYPDYDKWQAAEQTGAKTPVARENLRESARKRQRQLKVIAAVKLPYLPPEKRKGDILAVGGFADIAQQSQGKMLAFGGFPLVHVDMQTGRDYIEARSGSYIPRGGGEPKTRSVSTIKRDIVHMSSVFAHIEFATDLRNMWQAMGAKNPFAGVISKRHLAAKIKEGQLAEPYFNDGQGLTPDKEKLLLMALDKDAQRTHHVTETQHEPPIIFRLSLATGLRLSEAVLLEWKFVDLDKKSLWLPKHATKTKGRRRVVLSQSAIEILNSLPRDAERLFKLSVAGLNSAMARVYKDPAIKPIEFSWHDLRRAHITRTINNNPTLTATQLAYAAGDGSTKRVQSEIDRQAEDRAYQNGTLTEAQKKKSYGQKGDITLTHYMEEAAEIKEAPRATPAPNPAQATHKTAKKSRESTRKG